MPASRRRMERRLCLGANRKLDTFWRIGGATVGVVNLGSHRVKAEEGAEKSCRKAKTRRGQRARCKKREGKSRSGNHVRPSRSVRRSRTDRAFAWSEKRATSFLERIEEIRSWPQGQKKTDAMRALRKCFVSGRRHVMAVFGSSISWSRFLFLTGEPMFLANPDLAVSICSVRWEDVLKGTNIQEVKPPGRPHVIRDHADRMRIMSCAPALAGRARYKIGQTVSDELYRKSRAPKSAPIRTPPRNKTIGEDEASLRPRTSQVGVTSQAKVCKWCRRKKGVVHGNMACDRSPTSRGHQFVAP